MLDGAGAVVMGRTSFDKNEGDGGWGDGGPLGDTPCFVVTHREPTTSYPPVYTFVTDGVASAIEGAKRAAGDKVVGLHGATVMQQALQLGLVDEIRVHIIPSSWAPARRCSRAWTRPSASSGSTRWRPRPRRTWPTALSHD